MAQDFQGLLAGLKTQVTGVTDDSRKVKKGYLFIAIKGLTSDGHKFIKQARENGAKIVVGERGGVDVKVPNARRALSLLASAYYDNPSKKLKIIGITGTDGKTTTASLVYWLLKKVGKKVGLVSTVSAIIGEKQYGTGLHTTNPEPLVLQEFLSKMVKAKCEYAVLEVTSHGLDQERVYGIDFDVGILTNITHEHLDYHKTLKSYIKAKAKLFNSSKISFISKKHSNEILKYLKSKKEMTLYDAQTLTGEVRQAVLSRFNEPYNLSNATAAILTARKLGIKDKNVINAIKTFPGVEGRMQEIKNNKGIRIIVDFAHTPNALENVLNVLKPQTPEGNKLTAVFGCAGERDAAKRPMMAEISTRLANTSVFTAEDPRGEKIDYIMSQMLKGAKNKHAKISVIKERGEAISYAITKLAKKGDVVVICGKGHEKSMNYGGVEYPWSDVDAVHEVLLGKTPMMERTAIFGLGVEGKDLLEYFIKTAKFPAVIDENQKQSLNISPSHDDKYKLINGVDAAKYLPAFNVIYRSPGVYRYRDDLIEAEKSGARITSALRLFFNLCPAKVIGVTGTKGKGTTSTLIYKILKSAGKRVYLAGNIGKPYLKLLGHLEKTDFVVLELSSFQLIDIDKSPDISVVLNITVDHLDWHKNIKEYVDAKSNIIRYQDKNGIAFINNEYATTRAFSKLAKGKVVFFSKNALDDKFKKHVRLLGEHNLENVAAAVSVAKTLEINDAMIIKAISGFTGLEHRLEMVRSINGVTFYNDSFSTNPEPTIAAVKSFNHPMTIILGGSDKGLDYTKMGKVIAATKNVKNILLIGNTAKKINHALIKARYGGNLLHLGKPSMEKIVAEAFRVTPKGGVVVLSPASASFDMFKDYKERGKVFKESVRNLKK
jgi:UDP-N-acetylmuramoyl-L-alanyl-D-glutamate--2,6-diaminopimelate ligase